LSATGTAVIKHTLALSLLFLLPTHAKDVGQWGRNVSPELKFATELVAG
jgi:hypothetical protein